MYALVVTIHVKPEYLKPFIEATLENARNALELEPGCFVFNVVQDEADLNCVYLYEVYRDSQAFDHHAKTPHFAHFRATTKDWFARPMEMKKGRHLYPPDEHWEKPDRPNPLEV